MSETTPPANPASPVTDGTGATGAPTLTPAQVSAMREAWAAYGYSADRFDAMAAGQGSAHTAPSVTPSATPAGAPATTGNASVQLLGNTKSPPISAAQALEMVAALERAGVDPERIAQAVKTDGLGLVEDPRSDAERAHDASWGFDRIYQPGEYQVDYQPYARDMDGAKLAAFNDAATGWLASMQAMPFEGKFLIERAMEVGRETAGLSETDRATGTAKQKFDMEQRFGADGMAEQLRLASYALRMGRDHPFYAELQRAGSLNDPFIVRTLANIGRRIEGWTKGGKK